MKDKKHLFLKLLCFTFLLGSTAAGGAACKDKPNEPAIPDGYDKHFTEVGSYYADEGETRNTFELTDSMFTLKLGGQTIDGTYLYNGTKLRLVTTDGTIIEATYSDAAIKFTYNGMSYTFIKNVEYTVKFEMNGGVAQADAKVLNGKKLEKPADPVKTVDGKEFAFIGWYKDSSFKEKYSFDQPVTKDITLYAYFVELLGTEEYTVTFSGYTGAEFPGKTTGRKLFNLPQPGEKDGAKFLGWWYSAYNDETKLTAKYNEGDAIYENIVLYAVWENSGVSAVSVGEKEISWTSLGVNKSYEITVAKLADDGTEQAVRETTISSLKYSFDFSAEEAGDYVVTVKSGNSETKAYYKNKTLARVCLFAVKYPSVFTFGAVEGAEKYLLTYECGTENHVHEEIDLGTDTFYDFSGCAMKEGGITFTVTAVAKEGYRNSVSATYTFDGSLATPENFVLDGTNEKLSWSAVKYADYYLLTINDGEAINMGTKTSFDLKGYAKGEYTIKLVAVGRGFNNSVAATATWTKSTLAAPSKPVLNDYTLTWNAVEGAKGYIVKIGDRTIDTDTNAYTFTAGDFAANKTYAISVCAKDETAAGNSLFGEILTLTTAAELNPEYSNGTLTWNSVVGAKKYEVQVNDGEVFEASDAFAKVTLTTSGNNILRVRSYNAAGEASAWAETTVEAYTLSYNVGDSEQTIADRYYATGDEIALPAPDFNGYDFAGWYDGENGAGRKYELTYGALPVFENDGNLTLYAKWEPKSYQLTLDGGTYNASDLSEGATVKYRQPFTLPVPESNDTNRAFVGWFNGNTQVADQNGASITENGWQYLGGATLTARWAEIFEFEAGFGGYNVKKPAAGAKYLTTITVPATYNGKKVLEIKAEAFTGCKNIVAINIPNSITKIVPEAFSDCSALESVTIYEVEGTVDPVYYSPEITGADGKTHKDGVVIKNDGVTGKTLFYFPNAKTGNNGVYAIPDDVETIPAEIFSGRELTKIIVPASVTNVMANGFATARYLTEVEFLAAPEGTEEKALTIDEKAFEGCYRLENLILPARLMTMKLYDAKAADGSYTQSVFKGCSHLANIEVRGNAAPNQEQVYSAQNGMLLSADGKTLLYYPAGKTDTTVVLPDSVTSIGDKAFYKNTKIKTFAVPARLQYIGESAFEGCGGNTYGLETLTFEGGEGDADLRIEDRAFYGCQKIKTLTLTENVRYLGVAAFGGTYITEVTVNSNGSVTFKDGAFVSDLGGSSVKTLHIGKGLANVDISAVFGGTNAVLATVTVDKENSYYYEGSDGVIYDKHLSEEQVNIPTKILYYPMLKEGEYELPGSITTIGANVFVGRQKLTKVTIGANVTEIGNAAFKDCTALTEVVWKKPVVSAEGVTAEEQALTLGDNVFSGCYGFTAFVLPARVTSIGDGAFQNCKYMTTFTFEDGTGALTIGAKAFSGCHALTALALREGVVSVGDGAFANCAELVSVSLPASVERLGTWAEVQEEGSETKKYTFVSMDLFKTTGVSPKLERVDVNENNTHYYSENGMLFGKYEKEGDETTAKEVPVRLYFCPFAKTGDVKLPNTLIEIYKEAFAYNTGVTSVSFNGELAGEAFDIGENALYNAKALTTFELPVGLKTIKTGLFKGCSGLKTIVVPNTVSSIAAGAFQGCVSLATVNFAEGNDGNPLVLEDGSYSTTHSGEGSSMVDTTIYTGAFGYYYEKRWATGGRTVEKGCISLTSIKFPKRLSYVGTYAFYGCESLTTIDFGADSNVGVLGDGAFMNTPLNMIKNGDDVQADATGKLTLTLPEKLTAVRARAFYATKFPENTTIKIGANVTDFGEDTISSSAAVYSKAGRVFGETNVKEVIFADNNKLAAVHENAFADSDGGKQPFTSVSFGNNSALETIKYRAFGFCSQLTNIDFGENSKLKTIEENAFQECVKLENIALPATLETIDREAFCDCSALKTITFETYAETNQEAGTVQGKSSLRSIGTQAFENTGLTSFTFPETIEVLNTGALSAELFKGCRKLKTIELSSTVADISKVFDLCGSITEVKLPTDESGNQLGYFKADGSVIYSKDGTEITYILGDVPETFEIKEGVTTLKSGVFAGKATLKKVIIPVSVTVVEEKAFYDCLGLETVQFAENSALDTIGASAFRNCISLKSISIPSKVTTLNPYTFYNCKSLVKAVLPENLTRIGYYVYNGTEKLSSSGGYVFAHCENLAEINIPESVKWIQNYSFLNCKSLTEITLNANDKQVGEGAFANCSSLKKVTLGANIKTLPSRLFINCTSLESIVGANSTNQTEGEPKADLSQIVGFGDIYVSSGKKQFKVGSYTFQNCTSIKEVILSSADTSIVLGDYLFDGCTNLAYVNKTKVDGTEEKPVYLSRFPDQLVYLGKYSFRNTALSRVRMPDSLTSLGETLRGDSDYTGEPSALWCTTEGKEDEYKTTSKQMSGAFDGCTQLTYLDLNNVIRIGGLAFRNCPLTEVAGTKNAEGKITGELDLSKVQVFGKGAFAGTGLKKVNLSGVWYSNTGTTKAKYPMGFGDGAEDYQTQLTNSDSEGVFENCAQLETVTFSEVTSGAHGTSSNQAAKITLGKLMFKNCGKLESVVLPKSVTALPQSGFYGCSKLSGIVINGTLTSFGNYTFAGCTSLEAIDLSEATATSIATGMFDGCEKLADVKLNTGRLQYINDYAFRNCVSLVSEVPEDAPDNAKISAFPFTSLTKVTKFGTSAFEGCTGITKLETATLERATGKITIGSSAFRGCSSLTSVTLSKNVTAINTSAFGSCAKLTTFNTDANTNFEANNGLLYKADGTIICIPAGFESNTITLGDDDKIGAGALDGCVNLKKLVLPESMTTIAAKYFQDAKYLEEIVISSKTESIGNYAFDGSVLKKITYNGYKSDEAETLKTSVFPATLKTIGQYAFMGTQLEKVIIPETLNGVEFNSKGIVSSYSIKDGAFSGSALKSVVIEGAETYFAMNASNAGGVFANCVQLTDVKFMAETAQYGKNLFYGCTALTSVQLPSKATTLGESMFAECTALTSITLPETLTALPGSIFQNCTGLTSVTIPESVTTLGNSVFRGSGIKEIEIPAGIEAIPNWTFMDCANLTKVVFHEGLTSIGSHAFENCTALEKVELPEGLTQLDGFTGCTNLKEITLPGTLESISSSAFNDCTALKSLVIPSSVTSVKFAFKGWTAEQTIYIEKSPSEVYNQWATDSDGGYYWFMYDYGSSESQYFYPCEAKIVWNYSPEATTAGENAK